jgi:hypothetical protein
MPHPKTTQKCSPPIDNERCRVGHALGHELGVVVWENHDPEDINIDLAPVFAPEARNTVFAANLLKNLCALRSGLCVPAIIQRGCLYLTIRREHAGTNGPWNTPFSPLEATLQGVRYSGPQP